MDWRLEWLTVHVQSSVRPLLSRSLLELDSAKFQLEHLRQVEPGYEQDQQRERQGRICDGILIAGETPGQKKFSLYEEEQQRGHAHDHEWRIEIRQGGGGEPL